MAGTAKLQRGLKLGSLEKAVLNVLWSSPDPLTVREVHSDLNAARPLAYTTVMTVLYRLTEKGLLVQSREGRAFSYTPAEGRADLIVDHILALLAECGPLGRGSALVRLVGRMGADDTAVLLRALSGHALRNGLITALPPTGT